MLEEVLREKETRDFFQLQSEKGDKLNVMSCQDVTVKKGFGLTTRCLPHLARTHEHYHHFHREQSLSGTTVLAVNHCLDHKLIGLRSLSSSNCLDHKPIELRSNLIKLADRVHLTSSQTSRINLEYSGKQQ